MLLFTIYSMVFVKNTTLIMRPIPTRKPGKNDATPWSNGPSLCFTTDLPRWHATSSSGTQVTSRPGWAAKEALQTYTMTSPKTLSSLYQLRFITWSSLASILAGLSFTFSSGPRATTTNSDSTILFQSF